MKQNAGWPQMMIKMMLMILMVMKTELLVATQYNLELRGVRTRNTQRVMIKLQLKDSSGKQGFFFDIIDRQKCGDDDDSCLHIDDEFLRSARTKVWGKNDAKAFQTAKVLSTYWVLFELVRSKKGFLPKSYLGWKLIDLVSPDQWYQLFGTLTFVGGPV